MVQYSKQTMLTVQLNNNISNPTPDRFPKPCRGYKTGKPPYCRRQRGGYEKDDFDEVKQACYENKNNTCKQHFVAY
jgi:hypothetical protein